MKRIKIEEDQSDENEQRKVVHGDRDFTTNRISDLCRYISFGILIGIFALLTASSPKWTDLPGLERISFFISGMLAALTIIFDYLQYVAGYLSSSKAYDAVESNYEYDTTSCSTRIRGFSFWVKQITMLIAAILFCISLAIFML